MDTWHWPQYLIAALIVIGVIAKFVMHVRDRSLSSERVTIIVIAWLVYIAAYSYVLRAGGFW